MQWHLFLVPNLCAAIVSLALMAQVRRKSQSPAKRPFLGLLSIIVLWNIVYGLSVAATDPATKTLLMIWRMVPTAFTGMTTLLFFAALVGEPIVITRKRAALLLPVPVGTALVALAGDPYHWLFESITVRPETPLIFWVYGPWAKVPFVFGWVTFGAGMILLGTAALRAAPPYRQQLWVVFVFVLPAAVLDFLHASGRSPIPGYNLTPAFLSITGLGFAYAMQRYGLIDLAPIARRAVVDRMPSAMLVADADGRLVDLNEAARTLLEVERNHFGSLVADALVAHPPLVALLTGPLFEGMSEVSLRQRVFDASISTLAVGERMVGRVLVLHEVTERKQREEQIRLQAREVEELSRVRDAFVTTVSHELRTPLNIIVGATDMLRESSLSDEVQSRVEMIHDAGELLVALVNDVLSLAKLRAGKIELETIPFASASLLERSAGLFALVCRQKGLVLHSSIPSSLPTLLGDPTRVQQVVVNLLGNAVKFTQEGEIRIDASYSDGRLVTKVSDTGPGIPPEKRSAIFEAFSQADTSTTRRYGGTGLGLAIVHGLVEQMRGSIVVSENVPHGTVFEISLPFPVAAQPAATVPISKENLRAVMTSSGSHAVLPSSTQPKDESRVRVLIVDDVFENRVLLQEMLRREPIDVTLAEDGHEAIERFQSAAFDLILLDIEMPGLDGYSVVRAMRSWEQTQARKPAFIAALTAHGTAEHEERSREAGFSTHLTKPVRKRALLELIGRA